MSSFVDQNHSNAAFEFDAFLGSAVFDEIDFDRLGIDPQKPTEARPGTEDKVLMLAARYAAGLPLWNHEDCYDHAPTSAELRDKQPQTLTAAMLRAELVEVDETAEETTEAADQ
ncbi:MAG: hypothetical protein O3A00_26575 [Planctomycetota bacterium]|nr:hypothetical protein [Planctomycetota bacterium]